MWKHGMSLPDAVAHVRRVRPEAFAFSFNFQTALERFETQCNSKNESAV
jgi:hypothetical protein